VIRALQRLFLREPRFRGYLPDHDAGPRQTECHHHGGRVLHAGTTTRIPRPGLLVASRAVEAP